MSLLGSTANEYVASTDKDQSTQLTVLEKGIADGLITVINSAQN